MSNMVNQCMGGCMACKKMQPGHPGIGVWHYLNPILMMQMAPLVNSPAPALPTVITAFATCYTCGTEWHLA